jgi:glycosyltransferase involved in cell wall biosynthesis
MSSRGSFWRKRTLLRIAQANGASVLLHLHSGVFHRFADGGTFLRRRAIRRAFADADAVVVVSPEWRTWVTGFTGRSDVTVVPNPVTLPPRDAVGSLPPHVVFLGRLSRHKGVEVMLDAIRALQNAGVEATYTIAGHGRVERFRRLARALPEPGAVKVPGWLDDEAKSELLSRSDILCMPSYGEGAPVALLEGMAWGLGCVATAVGGVPSIITDRVHGLLVAPGDEHALAAVVRELLEDAGLRDRLGAAARGRVAERHDPRSTAETLATVYRTTHARRDAASGPASRAAVDMRGGRE